MNNQKDKSQLRIFHFAKEHLTWLSVCGFVAVITGFTPEEWIGHLATKLRITGVVNGHWPVYLDFRSVVVAVGVGVIVTDVLMKRRVMERSEQASMIALSSCAPRDKLYRELIHRFRLTKKELLDPDPISTPNASRLLPLTAALNSNCAYGTNLYQEFEGSTVRQIIVRSDKHTTQFLQYLENTLNDLERLDSRWRGIYNKPEAFKLVNEMVALVAEIEGRLTNVLQQNDT